MKDMNDFDLKNNEEELRIVAQSHNEKANIWSIDSASHCTPKLMFSSEIRHWDLDYQTITQQKF